MDLYLSREIKQSRWVSKETTMNPGRENRFVLSPAGMIVIFLIVFIFRFRPSFILMTQPTNVQAPSPCTAHTRGREEGPISAGQSLDLEVFQFSGPFVV